MLKELGVAFLALLLVVMIGCRGSAVPPGQAEDEARDPLVRQPTQETLSAGTIIHASLQHSLSTGSNAPGDRFKMKVVKDIEVDGAVIVPSGSSISGIVSSSVRPGRVKGRARMTLEFKQLTLPDGRSYPLSASKISKMAPASKKRDAMIIGGGTGIGAAIGGIAGGKKGAAIGALTGGGTGTGAVLATRGKETGFSSGSRLKVRLSQPLTVSLS